MRRLHKNASVRIKACLPNESQAAQLTPASDIESSVWAANVSIKTILRTLFVGALVATIGMSNAYAASPWSVTLYGGPSSNSFFGRIFLHGKFDANGAMAGLAGDYRIANLGRGFTFEAELQLAHIWAETNDTIGDFGIGFRFHDFPWSHRLPTSFAVYTGPSYASNPPSVGISDSGAPVHFQRENLLNYVAIEFAVAMSPTSKWDGVIRLYHRSGAFGLYSSAADEGTAFGLGIRRRF